MVNMFLMSFKIAGALRLPSSINIARFLLGSPNTFIVEFNFLLALCDTPF